MRKKLSFVLVFLLLLCNQFIVYPKADVQDESPNPGTLFGQSALLMDGDTGRVLYEKEGALKRPMASTTKILTCLVALENSSQEDVVTVSKHAASQPDVQMNIREGERYLMGDLLRGLMLESYNDVAVAVAEHVGGSVEGFAAMMNEKALSLGCTDSHFVTPNGLDARDAGGEHSTTALDLAKILKAAIQNEDFLAITRTKEHTIREQSDARTVTARNKNALLNTMEGAISGKTGFTGKAGYCYAGAVKKDDRTLIAVTLGSGWPPHKNYKWQDMQSLFGYGFEHFHYQSALIDDAQIPGMLSVKDGRSNDIGGTATVSLSEPEKGMTMLIKDGETLEARAEVEEEFAAPVKKGDVAGRVVFSLDGEIIREENIVALEDVQKVDYGWNLYQVFCQFFVKNP